MAVEYDIEFAQGETYTLPIIYNDPTGAPYDLTTYTAVLEAHNLEQRDSLVVQVTSSSGITLSNGSGGTPNLVLVVSSTVTPNLPSGNFDYELWVADGSTPKVKTRLLFGKFKIDVRIVANP